jgi:hypothetical protein
MRGELKTAANMLYLYEIVKRTPKRYFESNQYVIVH